ncbi:hypothetical protein [Pseudarthrobacter chlorophenolicus]|uniref:hypothetical protein n=1 Tax=Pseudarthrobacter chlorophenolicus TaxID=85085 RepID=UPI000166BA67|nr:hypothetical protein [Pseudarthrobacter chlorophenolicus]
MTPQFYLLPLGKPDAGTWGSAGVGTVAGWAPPPSLCGAATVPGHIGAAPGR